MVMDQQTRNALAEIRGQLVQLRAALNTTTPDAAADMVQQLTVTVAQLASSAGVQGSTLVSQETQITTLQDTVSALQTTVNTLQGSVTSLQSTVNTQATTIAAQQEMLNALVTWAENLTSLTPFVPPS
jgi:peptidoglycan hydrolase CwlO-like protein